MAGGHAAPSLAYAEELVAPDGVKIPTLHGQARGKHNRLRILGRALFGERHTSSKQLKTFGQELHDALPICTLFTGAPTVQVWRLLKMVLGLDFCLASKYGLSLGLHDFTLGQHTAAR